MTLRVMPFLLITAALAAELVLARESKRVRQICVPDATGTGWLCGPEHDPPRPPPAPPPPSPRARAAPPPPPFLADPRLRREGGAPLRLDVVEPTMVTRPTPSAPPTPAPVIPSPEAEGPRPDTATAPVPAPAPSALDPDPVATSDPPPRQTETPLAASPRSDFLALPADGWAIQLAAGDPDELRVPEGLPAERSYLVPAPGSGYFLVLAPFRSIEEARTEAAALSARLGHPVWPRRIGPLQNEWRRAAVIPPPR